MRLLKAILFILLIWSCSNNNSNLKLDSDTLQYTTNNEGFDYNLEWVHLSEYLEYAIVEQQPAMADCLSIQLQNVGSINDQGEFIPSASIYDYSFLEDQIFGVKIIDDLIERNSGKSIYFKIKTDSIVNKRTDLLENIIVKPIDELTQIDFDELLKDLNDLNFTHQTEITKHENTFMLLNANDKDSIVFIKLRVTPENRNIDSLLSKINQLKSDKRIDSAFFNDLLEQIREHYIIIKITTNKNVNKP